MAWHMQTSPSSTTKSTTSTALNIKIATTMSIALRSTGCYSCRQWMLRSFIASIGGQPSTQPPPQRRQFSGSPRRWNEARERLQAMEHPLKEINDAVSKTAARYRQQESAASEEDMAAEDQDAIPSRQQNEVDWKAEEQKDAALADMEPYEVVSEDIHEGDEATFATPTQTSDVPWYLQPQHQPLEPSESPMAARQRLPALPDHPPPLLKTLLTHLSIDLGMDDLSLLDLRTLDPPPALGANLLMILGTARSEKHLHVSADKLCRWLRSDPHFLTPFADGLLGRNELKLKMRRRAKRTRLMAGVGAKSTAETDLEEGIRTGWVCVNVGRVEGGELPGKMEEERARRERIVGFGTVVGGSRIVVQLMTEEKRGELDLERLWTGILNRSRAELEGREREDGHGEDVNEIPGSVALDGMESSVQKEASL